MSLKLIINTFILCGLSFFSENANANKKIIDTYISTYKNVAIKEMKRTGIPASIKLAQGILESDMGRSPLAFQANNHFGIKCGKEWNGDIYHKLDDDKDSTGTLIESCFRAFRTGEESYIAHSEFLTNPTKQSRYGFLFQLGSTDYVGWAHGLKYSGYATDPSYPAKLIKIIESHKLYTYDEQVNIGQKEFVENISTEKVSNRLQKTEPQIVKAKQNSAKETEKEKQSSVEKYSNSNTKKSKTGVINDLKMVYASGAENVKDIARRTGNDVFEILEYNEELKSQDYVPEYNEIVYLEKKKKNIIENGPNFHIVNNGETMYAISQKYGVRLESLLAKNNLSPSAVPLTGETISLIKNVSKNDTPKHRFIEKFDSFVDLGGLQ